MASDKCRGGPTERDMLGSDCTGSESRLKPIPKPYIGSKERGWREDLLLNSNNKKLLGRGDGRESSEC